MSVQLNKFSQREYSMFKKWKTKNPSGRTPPTCSFLPNTITWPVFELHINKLIVISFADHYVYVIHPYFIHWSICTMLLHVPSLSLSYFISNQIAHSFIEIFTLLLLLRKCSIQNYLNGLFVQVPAQTHFLANFLRT